MPLVVNNVGRNGLGNVVGCINNTCVWWCGNNVHMEKCKKETLLQFKPLSWKHPHSALCCDPWTVHCRSYELLCETSLARFTPFHSDCCPGLHQGRKQDSRLTRTTHQHRSWRCLWSTSKSAQFWRSLPPQKLGVSGCSQHIPAQ